MHPGVALFNTTAVTSICRRCRRRRRRHPLRLRLVACSSLNGSHPTIAYGVFPHFSSPLDDSQGPVSYTHLDVYKRQT